MEIRYLRPMSISQTPGDTDFRSLPMKDRYVQFGKKVNKKNNKYIFTSCIVGVISNRWVNKGFSLFKSLMGWESRENSRSKELAGKIRKLRKVSKGVRSLDGFRSTYVNKPGVTVKSALNPRPAQRSVPLGTILIPVIQRKELSWVSSHPPQIIFIQNHRT